MPTKQVYQTVVTSFEILVNKSIVLKGTGTRTAIIIIISSSNTENSLLLG
jgi:hypothetical protein